MPVLRLGTGCSFFIPNRYTVTPPKLPAYTPVLYVFQPVQVGFFPALGKEFDMPVTHRILCLLHPWVFEEPLLGKPWFNRHISPFGKPDIVLVFFLVNQATLFLKFFRN